MSSYSRLAERYLKSEEERRRLKDDLKEIVMKDNEKIKNKYKAFFQFQDDQERLFLFGERCCDNRTTEDIAQYID